MSQCKSCHFYDRNEVGVAEGQALQWGLCRRDSPRLHPLKAKTHTIEGVWPTVRDDDWCGQWQAQKRRVADHPPAAVVTTPSAQPGASAPRPVPMHGGAGAIAAGYKPTGVRRPD